MHHARTERIVNGINAKMRFLAQTKGRREKERERKRKGKEEEGKEKGKGEREREIGSEALAETEKIANAPAVCDLRIYPIIAFIPLSILSVTIPLTILYYLFFLLSH